MNTYSIQFVIVSDNPNDKGAGTNINRQYKEVDAEDEEQAEIAAWEEINIWMDENSSLYEGPNISLVVDCT